MIVIPDPDELDLRAAMEVLGSVPVFDGPAEVCPTCRAAISQLALALDLEGDALACHRCGAVLAA